ncbi:hypothetical protein FRAHR75_350038 [Frankia sp. Hr75.2]|nr:hypothetical protein FRAHR75_350038 [Frankia sp. Hr75.2]SQD93763.1 hypothetical protein FMEAI12_1860011 [Parafrankia sp. Ea1.12]
MRLGCHGPGTDWNDPDTSVASSTYLLDSF